MPKACAQQLTSTLQAASVGQRRAVESIIAAVNAKDAGRYVQEVSDAVEVWVGNELRLSGRAALLQNRREHFARHPRVRSAIQHPVSIGPRVVMHDRVWLEGKHGRPRDVVEVFTFVSCEIVRIDVIQDGPP